MDIGKRLRQLRKAKGMSQGDIEQLSGLMRSYVSRVEGGFTVPSLATLEKLTEALDVEPYQVLFEGNGKPAAPKAEAQKSFSEPTKKLLKMFNGMSSADRKTLLALAARFSKT